MTTNKPILTPVEIFGDERDVEWRLIYQNIQHNRYDCRKELISFEIAIDNVFGIPFSAFTQEAQKTIMLATIDEVRARLIEDMYDL